MIHPTFTEQHHWFLHTFWQVRQTQLSPLLPGVGMEPEFPFLPVNLLGVLSALIPGSWQNGVMDAGVPCQAFSPHSEAQVSWLVSGCQSNHSPGSRSLANKTLTFPCCNLFGHFWECQRNNRTSVTQPSPTCLSSPCYSMMISNHLSLHCCHQVASCSNPSDFHHFRVTLCLSAVSEAISFFSLCI